MICRSSSWFTLRCSLDLRGDGANNRRPRKQGAAVIDAERAATTDTATAIVNGMLVGKVAQGQRIRRDGLRKDSAAIWSNGGEPTPVATAAQADSLYATLSSLDSKATSMHVRVLSPDAAFVDAFVQVYRRWNRLRDSSTSKAGWSRLLPDATDTISTGTTR